MEEKPGPDQGKYIGIEYEQYLKSRDRYVGHLKWIGGQKIEVEGSIKRRERDQNLSKVIMVCENGDVFGQILRHIAAVRTPDQRGNYTPVKKFYLIDKSPFKSLREMFINGELINPGLWNRGGARDYLRLPFLSVFSGDK